MFIRPQVGDSFGLPGDSYGYNHIAEIVSSGGLGIFLVRAKETGLVWYIETRWINGGPVLEAKYMEDV